MRLKWFPWKYIIRRIARRHGFLDPMLLWSYLENFSQPSEVAGPVELIRDSAVFHARGLINSRAIPQNSDWIWPYWIHRQFNPSQEAFIPRAFSLTYINLTERNWTAVGQPGCGYLPIIDRAGLVTPHWDGWSLDFWLVDENMQVKSAARGDGTFRQRLCCFNNLAVVTRNIFDSGKLTTAVTVEYNDEIPQCRISVRYRGGSKGKLAVSLRPYNPEGISFIKTKKIPVILFPFNKQDKKHVRVITQDQEYLLPDDAEEYFFDNKFVNEEIVGDFINACHHPDAGNLIISGYQGPSLPYYSFAMENGSHGGVTEDEYKAFFTAPENCAVNLSKGYVRPADIRNGVLHVLGRKPASNANLNISRKKPGKKLRIMTYNVHSCVGMDGKLSPLRIAKVIEQFNADIINLQELDIGRRRSEKEDQARIIADILDMDHFFYPAISLEEELYGDAVLSRFPMHLVKADILPGHKSRFKKEPRGAIWVEIETAVKKLQVINTHLGLNSKERNNQIMTLLGQDWVKSPDFFDPAILCGDFNLTPRSRLYKKCLLHFNTAVPQIPPRATYCGRKPFIRPDHILFRGNLTVNECKVGDTHLARIASDHRPLIAEFIF